MRLVLGSVLFLTTTAYAADAGWREYVFPESGFAAEYPSRPVVETRDYHTAQTPDGVVPERVYSVNSGGVAYTVEVADFSRSSADKDHVIEEAARNVLTLGKMTHDESDARIDFNYGREIRVEDGSGGSVTDAIFFIENKLYQLRVVFPAGNTDPAGSSGIHFFQQTFRLLRGY